MLMKKTGLVRRLLRSSGRNKLMKRMLKYALSMGFLCIGLYQGYHSIRQLFNLLSMYSDVVIALNDVDFFMQYNGWDLYYFELLQTLLMLSFSTMCVYISQKRAHWLCALLCGIVGLAAYLVGIAYVGYLRLLSVDYLITVLFFTTHPILIIAFAVYYRSHQNCSHYNPLSIIPAIKQLMRKRN